MHNTLLQYCYILSALRVPNPLRPSILAISPTYLRIIIILDSISGKLRNIRRLWSLLIKFISVTRISCNLSISLFMSTLSKKIWVNTVKLLTQSGGNPLISKKNLKMILCLYFFFTGASEDSFIMTVNKYDFKIRHSGNAVYQVAFILLG